MKTNTGYPSVLMGHKRAEGVERFTKVSRSSLTDSFTTSFLNIGTIAVLSKLILWLGTCPVYCRTSNSILDLYSLNVCKQPLDLVISTNLSSDISWGQNLPPPPTAPVEVHCSIANLPIPKSVANYTGSPSKAWIKFTNNSVRMKF